MAWCQPVYDASVSMIRAITGLGNDLVPKVKPSLLCGSCRILGMKMSCTSLVLCKGNPPAIDYWISVKKVKIADFFHVSLNKLLHKQSSYSDVTLMNVENKHTKTQTKYNRLTHQQYIWCVFYRKVQNTCRSKYILKSLFLKRHWFNWNSSERYVR